MHPILEYIYNLLPPDRKMKSNGDVVFNGVCCWRTERPDTKHRAGMKFSDDGFVYNCFNCKFKCGYTVGQYMSKNCIQLLKDLGASKQDLYNIRKLVEESLNTETEHKVVKEKRVIRDIPDGYKSIKESLLNKESTPTLNKIYKYLLNRNPRIIEWEDIMWKDGQESFLIPCYEYGKVVGYSLRMLKDNIGSKYIHCIPSGYIYNFDILNEPREYEIVVEGQIDALSLNCISILSNVFTEDKLKRLLPMVKDKKVIILPDRDKAGIKLVDQVLNENLPFGVSFPDWDTGIKDAEDAVKKYGRLYTLYKVIQSVEFDKLKIEVKKTGWFPK